MSDDPACARAREVIPELAASAMPGDERAGALSHLSGCAACRRELRETAVVVDELLSLAPAYEPPAGFEVAVLARVAAGDVPPGRTRRRWLRPRPGPDGAAFVSREQDGPEQGASSREQGEDHQASPGEGGTPGRRDVRPGADGPQEETRRGNHLAPLRERRSRGRRGERPGGGGPGRGARRGRGWRRPVLLVVTLVAVAILSGSGVWQATEPDRTLAAGYRATLEAAHGKYLTAGGIYTGGRRVGQVFGYQGSPNWIFVAVQGAPVSGVYDLTMTTYDGVRQKLGQIVVANGNGTYGTAIGNDIADVRRITLTLPGVSDITGRFRQRTGW
ncbi:hypothetical protein [Spongiactinospora sp. TRM90649]|uniref:hypothetical protein n=1 Tax=Spongiactinospora sp. TRM90649 TaxID=3031114 RepID=UPI0023FA2E6E|nr:hypothetical protein [Spongiactinospora sp. TRM90649]MDF5752087.1 hypothetical protein [Spongiactinospora sp. TRM90649]